MAITAKELAKLLNLSEAAISMALNNKPGVSTKTRKKVLATAKEHGYDFTRIPEFSTPQISHGTIYFIIYRKHGAVVADTPFFSQLSEGIDLGCKKAKYFLNISYIYEGQDVIGQLNTFINTGCKGIILLGTEMQADDILPFKQLPVPLVLLDTYFQSIERDCVLIDNIQGAYLATSHLIQTRKTQPGYLHSSYLINNFKERSEGFYKAIRTGGLSPSQSPVHLLTPSVEGAYADMLALLTEGDQLADCYFADNDLIAAGAIKAFKEKGYHVPKDVAVIGFDNLPLSTYIDPPLTTINVPKQYMGEMAVQRLAYIIENSDQYPLKIEISTQLIERKSI